MDCNAPIRYRDTLLVTIYCLGISGYSSFHLVSNQHVRMGMAKRGENSVMIPLYLIALVAGIAVMVSHDAWAGDVLKLTIPQRSESTLVQRLNREGVRA